MKRPLVGLATLVVLASITTAESKNYNWIIGGGWSPEGSQVQIEHNIREVTKFLNSVPGEKDTKVYFTNGNASYFDVKIVYPWTKESDPLSIIFSDEQGLVEFRKNQLKIVTGGTEKTSLVKDLRQAASELRAGDDLVIYYNGHGLPDPNKKNHVLGFINPRKNYLRLWNDSRLNVDDLQSILSGLGPGVDVRFIFTQCYSGGFAKLAKTSPVISINQDSSTTCGFLAVSAWSEAEGCTASIDTGDYRDYSKFFFDALSKASDESSQVDKNIQKPVGLYDAHLETLRKAFSKDLPRSTSEVYIEELLPWHKRWLSTESEDNVYGQIADQLTEKVGIEHGGRLSVSDLRSKRMHLEREKRRLKAQIKKVSKEISSLKDKLKEDTVFRWPFLKYPYTQKYIEYLSIYSRNINDYIKNQDIFDTILKKQAHQAELQEKIVFVERQTAQLDKIMRLRKIARALSFLRRHGTADEISQYESLLACEKRAP